MTRVMLNHAHKKIVADLYMGSTHTVDDLATRRSRVFVPLDRSQAVTKQAV